ncbi:hypothetical protein SPRG_12037 [Saprolegnia parasitica CBS 223.65]|uniref:Transmembrane protein n=1 Tax=Saprolegnia parasitica (strain CBS 223.65) TaxID=695850 RepID=A0A067BYW3_SAPPC|nr:hypothetical protein SPRG_12037 [Saprolegnia parasitica CBS 223.65]KDO22050.1 hypothetical protein SPRG_12037 [Saprolegnia parasitica CBS 223.65]|eukprot:XP_012207195.1 hypothetical protein SPRG_12037 [Saprolegnia parasitica CBS 223.65]
MARIHAIEGAPAHGPMFQRHRWVTQIAGLLYMYASLAAGLYYVYVLTPTFGNDLWWASYNVSSHQSFLIDVVNRALATTSNGSLDLFAPSSAMRKSYTSPVPTTSLHPTYPWRIILSEFVTIEYAVTNLRTISASWSMRMMTQYCWVDFAKRWEVAHTAKRVSRCHAHYTKNGAAYLETVLRNVVWDDFLATWGGPGNEFTVAVQEALLATSAGVAWLDTTAMARDTTSIDDEMAFWRQHHVTYFQLQWANRRGPGITESMVLTNALGLEQVVALKNMDMPTGPWSSQIMYWRFINDLFVLQTHNRSLVRQSPNHFARNFSNMPALDLEVYQGLCTTAEGCVGAVNLLHTELGPFLSVDTFYMGVPRALSDAYAAYTAVLQPMLVQNQSFRALYDVLPEIVVAPTPPSWRQPNWTFFGGNPMCVRRKGSTYVQQSFDFADSCIGTPPLTVSLSKDAVVFAFLVQPSFVSIPEICALTTSIIGCIDVLTKANTMATLLPPMPDAAAVDAAMTLASASFLQLATNASSNWMLLYQPLLDAASPAWSFYGRVCFFEFIRGQREVVSFQGDVSNATIMSNAYPAVAYSTGQDEASLKTSTRLVIYFVLYTSAMLTGVVGLASLYAVSSRLHFVGANLLYFNRIVGSVWLGRPLQWLRGVTALCMLSTAPVALVSENGYTRLVQEPRSLFMSAVVTGEATWIIYVVNDILLLVFSPDMTRLFAPLSSLGVWLALLAIDVGAPLSMTATLHRTCYSTDMDYYLYCESAAIAVGSPMRLLLLVVVQVVGVLAAVALAWIYDRYFLRRGAELRGGQGPPLSVAGVCTVYTTPIVAHSWAMDKVVSVLSGMIPLRLESEHYLFDIKSWSWIVDTITYERTRPIAPSLAPRTASLPVEASPEVEAKRSRSSRLTVLLGLTYMVTSIFGSISYIAVSETDLANDIWWAHFNITGAHVFLANWFNGQLYMGAELPSFSLASHNLSQLGSFASSTSVFVLSADNFGSNLQHTQLNTLPAVIAGLRTTDACIHAPWIFTQYCFLDFQQTWPMANSARRQERCATMTTNGAVYLESLLRNVAWADWQPCWGAAFQIAFSNDLQTSLDGQRWLAQIQAPNSLSVGDEATYWRTFGIATYDVQWQNYKQIGLLSSYSVESAYGLVFPLTLQTINGSYRFQSQTSFKGYWALASDLVAVTSNSSGIGGLSLLRSSHRYAFANISMTSVLTLNTTLSVPMAGSFTLIQDLVGPFGSVDMYFIGVPRALNRDIIDLVNTIRAASIASDASQRAYANLIVPDSMYVTPGIWLYSKWISFGGSPFCADIGLSSGIAVTSGMLNLLSSNKPCSLSRGHARSGPTIEFWVVAAIMASLTPSSNLTGICELNTASTSHCVPDLVATVDFVSTHVPSISHSSIAASTATVQQLHIQLIQFMRLNLSSSLFLASYEVLKTPDDFTFASWILLMEWIFGVREVVQLVGDQGNLTVLGELLLPAQQKVHEYEIPTSGATYARAAVQYITAVVILVAGLTVAYIITSRGQIEGRNMFSLGSVGGVVWIGRPLLFLRSITAIGILSTGTLSLEFNGRFSYLQVSVTPWYQTLIEANELTWLAAVVNDVFIAYTREYNRYYNAINIALVWLVAGCVSLLDPAHHVASMQRAVDSCEIVEVDFQVVCHSAQIQIGQFSRLLLLIGIVFAVKLFCYVATRLYIGEPTPARAKSIVLYAGAKFLFRHKTWIYHDVYYLDRASALLNGMVTLRWREALYVLDIKTWRAFGVDMDLVPASAGRHVLGAIPLQNSTDRSSSFAPIGPLAKP